MIDLSDIGIIIHFRKDIEDRLRNLKCVLSYYKKHSKNLEVVIVNDDKEPDPCLKELHTDYGCKILFMKNEGLYHRTLAFNKGMRALKANYLIAGDTDVFIEPQYLVKGKEMFEQNDKLGILHPYNGMFVHLKQQLMDKFTTEYEINLLTGKIGELKPVPYHETVNFLVAHPGSKGGMVMYNKEKFIKCNGYNPNFVAWGFEDDEIINRVKRLGYEWDRVKDVEAIAWHFPHENTVREKHSMYQNNYNHSEFVGHCSDAELQEYLKKWKV